MPARQGVHDEEPTEEEKDPGLHGTHVEDEEDPLTLEAVPAGQVAHEIRVCPLSSLYVPAGQSKQAVDWFEAPGNDPYVPDGQGEHDIDDKLSVKKPTAQNVQERAPDGEYVPAGHGLQATA